LGTALDYEYSPVYCTPKDIHIIYRKKVIYTVNKTVKNQGETGPTGNSSAGSEDGR